MAQDESKIQPLTISPPQSLLEVDEVSHSYLLNEYC